MRQYIFSNIAATMRSTIIVIEIFLIISSLTLVDLVSIEGSNRKTSCNQRAVQLDQCLPKLIFYGDRNFDPPKNDKTLDKHCKVLDDNLKCVSSYSRECLPAFAKSIYSVMLRRLKTQFSKRCSGEGRQEFMNLMACADRHHMEPIHRCMDSFIAHLEHVGQGPQSRQIELTCCTFQLFQECIFNKATRLDCPQRVVSLEKSNQYVKTIINSMGGDIMEFMCGKFEKLSHCQAIYPDVMSKFDQISSRIRNNTLRAKSTSPLKPMLALFTASDQ